VPLIYGLDDLEKKKLRAPTRIRTPDNPSRRVVAIPTTIITFIMAQSLKAFRLTSVKVLCRLCVSDVPNVVSGCVPVFEVS
jgi:hypothetical protein